MCQFAFCVLPFPSHGNQTQVIGLSRHWSNQLQGLWRKLTQAFAYQDAICPVFLGCLVSLCSLKNHSPEQSDAVELGDVTFATVGGDRPLMPASWDSLLQKGECPLWDWVVPVVRCAFFLSQFSSACTLYLIVIWPPRICKDLATMCVA